MYLLQSMVSWSEHLEAHIPAVMRHEIDGYEASLQKKKAGLGLADPTFNEMRLRRGVYGQRYDNGRRHDGQKVQELSFPSGRALKGVSTKWDAPGMQRIKIPFGAMTPAQMLALADIAEEYADEILHITTRQDIQLHFVHIEDTPDMMRRLAAVGITTKEACGNVVRNVTACPRSGACQTESFDVSGYAEAAHRFMLGHPDGQNFGRKFKISFSGCMEQACGLVGIHDAGGIAKIRILDDGSRQRGFEFYVGGGLGAVPHQARLFERFLPEHALLPTLQAIARVFGRYGEKENRARARLKFLIAKMGFDAFKQHVIEERDRLPTDPRWVEYLPSHTEPREEPKREGSTLAALPDDPDFRLWFSTNVQPQTQAGYSLVTIHLPLGDLTSDQMRALARIAEHYCGGFVRTTVEQNLMLRWVPTASLPALYDALCACGLGMAGAGTIIDIVACPGTDTCKLGVASSRGLAGELQTILAERMMQMDKAARSLRVKVSGCFNSCGQHHVADIGFWGVARSKKGQKVPHFQLILGGEATGNARNYGLPVGAAPSKNIPKVLDRLVELYLNQREGDESFQQFVSRAGKLTIRKAVDDLMDVPEFSIAPEYYSDWGDPRTFTTGDIGVGECAGEVVESTDFDLQASERTVFSAIEQLEHGDYQGAAHMAYQAMVTAAKALVRIRIQDIGDDPHQVMAAFQKEYYQTEDFFDPFAKAKFANYYLQTYQQEQAGEQTDNDAAARKRIDEAQLFVEAAHSCYARMSA